MTGGGGAPITHSSNRQRLAARRNRMTKNNKIIGYYCKILYCDVFSMLLFGRPFRKRFALCMLSDRCLSCLSVCPVCDVVVLWPNGWMDQDETWHGGRTRPRPQCVRWESSSPQRGTAPNFRPMSVEAKRLDGLRCHLEWR